MFFFKVSATTEIYPLSLPAALPIFPWAGSLSFVAVRVLPSASVSLARTLAAVLSSTVTVPPSATVALSLLATGGSLTGVALIETGGVPLHFGAGGPVVGAVSPGLLGEEAGRESVVVGERVEIGG